MRTNVTNAELEAETTLRGIEETPWRLRRMSGDECAIDVCFDKRAGYRQVAVVSGAATGFEGYDDVAAVSLAKTMVRALNERLACHSVLFEALLALQECCACDLDGVTSMHAKLAIDKAVLVLSSMLPDDTQASANDA